MDPDFWQQRWQENQIGFHQAQFNDHIQQYWSTLAIPSGSRVFVPLCGKSRDMLWLREQGYTVVGVEVSALAVDAFFTENDLAVEKTLQGDFTHYQTDQIEIYCGDYFALTPNLLGHVNAVFDRASLIALPPRMRQDYVQHLVRLLDANTPVLLVTLEYPQHEMDGPPFSVAEQEVINLYAGRYEIDVLFHEDKLAKEPRFAQRGISALHEKVYLLS